MTKWLVILLSLNFVLSACASKAWIVSRRQDGGVIGYINRGDDVQEMVRGLIHCPNYETVSDDLRSQQSKGTFLLPGTETTNTYGTLSGNYGGSYSYMGQSSTSTMTPVNYTRTDYWREFTYRCGASDYDRRPTSYSESSESCEDKCARRYSERGSIDHCVEMDCRR